MFSTHTPGEVSRICRTGYTLCIKILKLLSYKIRFFDILFILLTIELIMGAGGFKRGEGRMAE